VGRGSNQAAESCHLLLERVASSVKSLSLTPTLTLTLTLTPTLTLTLDPDPDPDPDPNQVKSLSPAYMLAHELPLIVPFVRQRLNPNLTLTLSLFTP
jgi:hypothetical protein